MEAVVTGATGFIGGALSSVLLGRGWKVFGVGTDPGKLERLSGDRNFVAVRARFEEYPDLPTRLDVGEGALFIHCAWAGGFTNAMGDYHLQMSNAAHAGDALLAAKGLGCRRFVYAGTYNEYELQTLLMRDEPRFRPTCIYSAGKLAADCICRTLAEKACMEYCAAYIPMPYGEGNRSRQLVNVVLERLLSGVPPDLIEGSNLYDLVYIDDVAEGILAVAERGIDRRGYYVGHSELRTFREWMEMTRDAVAPQMELRFGAYEDAQCIDYSLVDLHALKRDTGFECRADFKETMRRTAEWLSLDMKEDGHDAW